MRKIKAMNIRFPHDLWEFISIQAVLQEKSFNQLVVDRMEKYRQKKIAKKKKTIDK
jgi:predicted HicB family RNase H-like nuclease